MKAFSGKRGLLAIGARLDAGHGPHFGRRQPAKSAMVFDMIAEYSALVESVPALDVLDAECDSAARRGRVPANLARRLRQIFVPGSSEYSVAESGLGRCLVQAGASR